MSEPAETSRSWLPETAAIVAIFLTLGALTGVLWAVLWEPPSGVAYQGTYVPAGSAAREAMSTTSHFVLLALPAGAVGGFAGALLARSNPLLSWAVGLGAAVLAAFLAVQVGHVLGPPDPVLAAREATDGQAVQADLSLPGGAALLVFPVGALAGFAAGFLVTMVRQR